MNAIVKRSPWLILSLFPIVSGCGLEEAIMGVIIDEPVVTTPIPGSVPEGAGQLSGVIEGALGEVTLRFYTALGIELESQGVEIDYGATPYTYKAVVLPETDFPLHNIRVIASFGDATLKAIVADPANGGDSLTFDLNTLSTTIALALELKPVPRNQLHDLPSLNTPTPEGASKFQTESPSPTNTPEGSPSATQTETHTPSSVPETTPSATPTDTPTPTPTPTVVPDDTPSDDTPSEDSDIVEKPALASFPCEGIDLFVEAISGQILTESGPGFDLFQAVEEELTSGATQWPDVIREDADLDENLADLAVAAGESASADGTLEYGFYRVIMGVVRIQAYPDHKCFEVNIDKWVNPVAGDSLFLVGGIHEDSPIQDPTIQNDVLPNWIPNTLPMYDDGTHGDEVSGDNLWTRSFVFPEGLRIGYKYTFGAQGQNWTGTEEWPGNQRLLEIFDINGDGYVARFDVFADERSNKDKQNLYVSGGTTLTWNTDLDGDGYPEAFEMPADYLNGDCIIDGFWQPLTLPPATTEGCL